MQIFHHSSKYYKKSLLCGLISQTSPENPPKNGGVKKAKLPAIFKAFLVVFMAFLPATEIIKIAYFFHFCRPVWYKRMQELMLQLTNWPGIVNQHHQPIHLTD